jgi:alcohol dehydrogenase/L-iditol 2-dehydrogenase
VRQLDDRPGDLVVVLGRADRLLCARMAALAGADPLIVVGLQGDAARLETATRLGATRVVNGSTENVADVVRGFNPLGADLVFEASGASRPLDLALALTRPDGQVTKVGWPPDLLPININPLVQKNLRLQGSFSHLPDLGTRHPPARSPVDAAGEIVG